jgi:replicative DNA helicase
MGSTLIERLLKINKEIAKREKSILASIMDDSLGTILTTDLTEGDFDDRLRADIFRWLRDCAEKNIWSDPTTAELDGGFPRNVLADLEKAWMPASAIQHTADKMRVLRRVRNWAQLLHREANNLLVDRQVEITLGRIRRAETKEETVGEVRTNEQVLSSAFDELKLVQDGEKFGRLPTGHHQLDRYAPGPGELLVIGGDSSMGKSLLASKLAEYMAAGYHDPIPCLFVSLEMSDENIARRKFAEAAGVGVSVLRTSGTLDDRGYDRIQEYIDHHRQAPLYWRRVESPDELVGTATRLQAQHDVRVVFVDYLQIMNFGGGGYRHDLRVGGAMQKFYASAKKTGLTYIVLSQLRKKQTYSSQDAAPSLQDLKETGAIRQIADEIWLIYRPAASDPSATDQTIHVRIAKDRDGAIGAVVRLEFKDGRLLDWAAGAKQMEL